MRLSPFATALVAATLLAACTPSGTTSSAASPAAVSAEAVLESREVLGDPMLQLAEKMLAVFEGIDAARHRLPRGTEMLRGVDAVDEQLAELRDAIGDAETAASQAPVAQAAAIVADAASAADRAGRAAAAELAFLRKAGAIDRALLAAADEWDRPGSQSEIRARLDEVARNVDALRAPAARLRPAPRGCVAMRRNRQEWVATVHNRTLQLQGQANSAGGTEYDRLRASYRALPLAVEPRTADRVDRDCWTQRSPVATAAPAMRDAVEQLRASLSG